MLRYAALRSTCRITDSCRDPGRTTPVAIFWSTQSDRTSQTHLPMPASITDAAAISLRACTTAAPRITRAARTTRPRPPTDPLRPNLCGRHLTPSSTRFSRTTGSTECSKVMRSTSNPRCARRKTYLRTCEEPTVPVNGSIER